MDYPRRILLVLVVGVVAAVAAGGALASPSRPFSFSGAGTNAVTIGTGELRERWSGHASPFGRISARVAGRIARPAPASLAVRATMTIVDASGDRLIGSCSGKGIPPIPKGSEDWACVATGGTGKFARSRGRWTLHIVIERISNANGVQRNRFTERGAGRICWNARVRG